MNPHFLAFMSASLYCISVSAQQFPKKDSVPHSRFIPPVKDSLRGDTLPMRVYQLKEFNVRHRNYNEDEETLSRLKKNSFKWGWVLPKEKDKGVAYEKEGRTHHLPGVAVDVGALASAFNFKKRARDAAFQRRLTEKIQERKADKMYNAVLVGRFIPLKDDSLYDFVDKTRPSAAFLADITAYDLGVYVKQRYKEYLDTLNIPSQK